MTTPSSEGNVDISINTEELKLALEQEKQPKPENQPETAESNDDDAMGGTGGENAGGAG